MTISTVRSLTFENITYEVPVRGSGPSWMRRGGRGGQQQDGQQQDGQQQDRQQQDGQQDRHGHHHRETKTILAGVSGVIEAGQLCAIIGPSGGGKTSLLDILAGRIPPSRYQGGSVHVNGQRLDLDDFRRVAGFVPQGASICVRVRACVRPGLLTHHP